MKRNALLAFTFLLFSLLTAFNVSGQAQEDEDLYVPGEDLNEVLVEGKRIKADTIGKILSGFFNAKEFAAAIQTYKLMSDKSLEGIFEDFEDAKNIKVLPLSYVEYSSFWFNLTRQWAREDFDKARQGHSIYISNEIKFIPLEDGTYELDVALTPSLHLENESELKKPLLDAKTELIRKKHWQNTYFSRPKDAREVMIRSHEELYGAIERATEGDVIVADAEKEQYYHQVEALLENPDFPFKKDLGAYWDLYNFVSQCSEQQFASYQQRGIIPYCLWKDQSRPTIPVVAGIVDAAWMDAEAIYDLNEMPQLLEPIREHTFELAYAYTVGAFRCTDAKMEAGRQEYIQVVRRLALKQPGGVWDWLEDLVSETDEEKLAELEAYFEECGEVRQYQTNIEELAELVTDWKVMLELYFQMEAKFAGYLATLEEGNDVSWYERGFLACQTALTFIPVGNVSKSKKARKVMEELANEANWRKFTDEVGRTGGRFSSYDKLLSKLDELEVSTPGSRQKFFDDFDQASDELLRQFDGRPELVEAWKKMDDLGADEALRRNPGVLEALNAPIGLRKNPNEYLSQSYINSHLSKFENDDIVRITTQSKIDEFGGTLGGPDAFVTTKTDFEDMWLETGGDLRKIEKKMGFDSGELGDDVVFAVIKREDVGTFKMASGNEPGVNSNWIPGGNTSGGMPEATLDLTKVKEFEPFNP